MAAPRPASELPRPFGTSRGHLRISFSPGDHKSTEAPPGAIQAQPLAHGSTPPPPARLTLRSDATSQTTSSPGVSLALA